MFSVKVGKKASSGSSKGGWFALQTTVSIVSIVAVVCFTIGILAGTLLCRGPVFNPISEATEQISAMITGKPAAMCSNTCWKANDGVCDEGRCPFGDCSDHPIAFQLNPAGGRVYELSCDLGTDCNDCGPWKGHRVDKKTWPHQSGPVEYLNRTGVKVFSKPTRTTPSFLQAIADPMKDIDVSNYIYHHGMLEGGISKVFKQVLRDKCVDPKTGKRRLVVDVGANFGYFTIMSAMAGCRVMAWEPVPRFQAFLQWSLAANNLTHLVTVFPHVLGAHPAGQVLTMAVPGKGIWGVASVNSINTASQDTEFKVDVSSQVIDEMVKEDVLLFKLDVEGYEPVVWSGCKELFSKYRVENFVMEYSPGVMERNSDYDANAANIQILVDLATWGYTLLHMPDGFAKVSDWYDHPADPKLPEITLNNLMYDMRDAQLWKERRLGCPVPSELLLNSWLKEGCNRLPLDAHVKSFRVSFWFNTNVWATLRKDYVDRFREGTVGFMPLDANLKDTWFPPHNNTGKGMIPCSWYTPYNEVRGHCRCSNATVCGDEQATAMRLAKMGALPALYDLPMMNLPKRS